MPRSVKVALGGQEFEVAELKSRQNRAWREKLESHFEELAQVLENAPSTELNDPGAAAHMVRTLAGKLIHSVDLIGELVVAYAPQLESALDEGYDSEVIEAFTAILGLAYPFGSTIQKLARQIGPTNKPTETN